MRAFSRSDRLRYWFDNTMSRGTIALIGWLAVVTVLLVVVVALVLAFTGIMPSEDGTAPGLGALIWDGFMQALSPEQVVSDSGSWPFLLVMLALTLGGLFIASTLIGVLTSGIEQKLDALRRGRSIVAESGHLVVLGWSSKTPAVVRELVLANESGERTCVAVLAPRDRTEMEEEIRDAVGRSGTTRVVCRTGDPIVVSDLEIVNPLWARAVLIPSPEDDEPDAQVVKMILALTNHPDLSDEHDFHVVAELRDPAWRPVAEMVAEARAELVPIDEVIARIIAQAARQTGLSVVVRELLTFEGNEIYVIPATPLAGRTYGEALFALSNASAFGLQTQDAILLNPPPEHVISRDDQLIVLAEDDEGIAWAPGVVEGGGRISADALDVAAAMLAPPVEAENEAEHILILGWSSRAPLIVCTLDRYLEPGSSITVVSTRDEAGPALDAHCANLTTLTVEHHAGDPTDRALLERLHPERFDHVIVLSQEADAPQAADTRALVTLLHLRDLGERDDVAFNIVSEMNDVRNQQLAEVTRADDFVVSDRLISLMVAQIAENRALARIFAELFSPDGAELYLRPAADYVALGTPLPFYAAIEAGRRRRETVIGCRLAEARTRHGDDGVRLNPPGTASFTFEEDDYLIVLAHE